MTSLVALFSLLVVLIWASSPAANALSSNHYDKTCPDVELIVADAVKSATMKDKTVPAALLRMHFHDCFIRVIGSDSMLFSRVFFLTHLNDIFLLFCLLILAQRVVMHLCCYTPKETTMQKKTVQPIFLCMGFMLLKTLRKKLKPSVLV